MSHAAEHTYRTIRESVLCREFAPKGRLKEADRLAQCDFSRTPVREYCGASLQGVLFHAITILSTLPFGMRRVVNPLNQC
jgi:hypothetical protein